MGIPTDFPPAMPEGQGPDDEKKTGKKGTSTDRKVGNVIEQSHISSRSRVSSSPTPPDGSLSNKKPVIQDFQRSSSRIGSVFQRVVSKTSSDSAASRKKQAKTVVDKVKKQIREDELKDSREALKFAKELKVDALNGQKGSSIDATWAKDLTRINWVIVNKDDHLTKFLVHHQKKGEQITNQKDDINLTQFFEISQTIVDHILIDGSDETAMIAKHVMSQAGASIPAQIFSSKIGKEMEEGFYAEFEVNVHNTGKQVLLMKRDDQISIAWVLPCSFLDTQQETRVPVGIFAVIYTITDIASKDPKITASMKFFSEKPTINQVFPDCKNKHKVL